MNDAGSQRLTAKQQHELFLRSTATKSEEEYPHICVESWSWCPLNIRHKVVILFFLYYN